MLPYRILDKEEQVPQGVPEQNQEHWERTGGKGPAPVLKPEEWDQIEWLTPPDNAPTKFQYIYDWGVSQQFREEPYYNKWGGARIECEQLGVGIFDFGTDNGPYYDITQQTKHLLCLNGKRFGIKIPRCSRFSAGMVKNKWYIEKLCVPVISRAINHKHYTEEDRRRQHKEFTTHRFFESEEEQLMALWIVSQGYQVADEMHYLRDEVQQRTEVSFELKYFLSICVILSIYLLYM